MTQDEIIRMALEAGLGEYLHLDGWRFTPDGDDIKSLERFYELAYATGAAHEREACANLRKEIILYAAPNKEYEDGFWEGLAAYEAAIKARSHK